MLVPLIDSTNPYTAMMLELIRDQQPRATSVRRSSAVSGTSRWHGVRTFFRRFRARRSQVPTTAA
jgi:hypothetical protein